MATANALIARLETAAPDYRVAPNNIDAEQALLGAILVNNDAYYRVSDFLEPGHFFEDLHKRIYEVATSADQSRQGRDADHAQDLPRRPGPRRRHGLAIPRPPRGRGDDRHQRRGLRPHGLRSRHPPQPDLDRRRTWSTSPTTRRSNPRRATQIEEAERRLYELAETGRYDGGFQRFSEALHDRHRHGGERLQARRQALRHRDRARRPRPHDGRPAALRPDHPRRPPRHGQDRARDQHRLQHRQGLRGREAARRQPSRPSTAASSASSRSKCRPSSSRPASSPSSPASPPTRSAAATSARTISTSSPTPPARCRRCRSTSTRPAASRIAQLAARARRLKRQRGLDLLVVDYLQLLSGSAKKGENRVQELTEITTGLKALAKELNVPILALSQLSRQVEQPRRQAPAALRPARIGLDRAGRRRGDVRLPRGVLPEEQGAEARHRRALQVAVGHGPGRTASAEVIIGKQRHGPTGTVQLAFQAEVTRFTNLADEHKLPDRMGD